MSEPLFVPPSKFVRYALGLFLVVAAGLATGVLAFNLLDVAPPVPDPPPGAEVETACGRLALQCTVVYLSPLSEEELFAYYREPLVKVGWRLLDRGQGCGRQSYVRYGYDRKSPPAQLEAQSRHQLLIVFYPLADGTYRVALTPGLNPEQPAYPPLCGGPDPML